MRGLVVSHTYVVGINQAKLEALAEISDVHVGMLVPRVWKSRDWDRQLWLEGPAPSIWTLASSAWLAGRAGAYIFPPWRAAQAIREFRPDIIQVEQEAASLVALEMACVAALTKIPLVVFGWENVNKPLPWARHLPRSVVLSLTALYIAGSESAAQVARQWGYHGPIAVLPQLGVDPGLFSPRKRRSSSGHLTVGYVGRLTHEKGVDIALRAIRIALDSGHPVSGIICGAGPEESRLRILASELDLDRAIDWIPAVTHEQVPDILSRISVVVLPSRSTSEWREQFGHILIEAMSMGVPVLGSTCGAIPDVIGRQELLFPEEDYLALSRLLARAAVDPAWLAVVGEYGENRVRESYTNEVIARKLACLWEKILS